MIYLPHQNLEEYVDRHNLEPSCQQRQQHQLVSNLQQQYCCIIFSTSNKLENGFSVR